MSVLETTYYLTYGDMYNISLGTVDPFVRMHHIAEKDFISALKGLEITNYPSGLEERVKSLLKKYYAHYKPNDIVCAKKTLHPLFLGHEMITISVSGKDLLVYFISPKT